jgi:hypothetical protein
MVVRCLLYRIRALDSHIQPLAPKVAWLQTLVISRNHSIIPVSIIVFVIYWKAFIAMTGVSLQNPLLGRPL